eukprot:TRINITY_DN74404_c0_g1_i1.p1 TRINITY_DN74404_c0_g1~~TRINITY_DN74404_c0_g1_i1.p1  ORF type:complete len:104 (+),score=2.01 TRINITY_DN74404_c0_g1_i1:1-312(+)
MFEFIKVMFCVILMRDRGQQLAVSQQANVSLPLPEYGDVRTDDAFETLMAILYGKLARLQARRLSQAVHAIKLSMYTFTTSLLSFQSSQVGNCQQMRAFEQMQ